MKEKVVEIKSLDDLQEREVKAFKIKHRGKVYPWKIWNLTGPEIDHLQHERKLREAELIKERPAPPTKVVQGEDVPIFDSPEYLSKKMLYDEKVNRKVGIWYEYQILVFGLLKCNGWDEPEGDEDKKIETLRRKLGPFWQSIINEIIDISFVSPKDVEDF